MKRIKYISASLAVLALAAASCTDFDDYNDAATYVDGAAGSQTLWQTIANDSELTDFANLLRRGGYDQKLDASQYYTVWAPVNGTFDYVSLAAMDSTTMTYRFIESHVAQQNYQLSGEVNSRVRTLNEKAFWLRSENGGTYDDKAITATANSVNGTIYKLNGWAEFFPNVYEYIFDANDVDSIRNYIKRYESNYLDLSASTEGPIVDGEQTYSDSVMVTLNSLTYGTMRAYLDVEDSSYTMILPNNEAYVKAVDVIKPCFNYVDRVSYRTLTYSQGAAPTNNERQSDAIDGAYYTDSMTNVSIVRNVVFSENNPYNQRVLEGMAPEEPYMDSIMTTRERLLSNGPELMNDYLVGDVHELSNGHVRIVDSLAFIPWEVWNPEIISTNLNTTGLSTSASGWETNTYSDGVTSRSVRFYHVVPPAEGSLAEIYFNLPQVRSTAYNVYIVFVGNRTNPRPYKFSVEIMHANADGSINAESSAPYSYGTSTSSAFTSDTIYDDEELLIDTFLVKDRDTNEPLTVTFPTCYYGLDVSPYIKIKSRRSNLGTARPDSDRNVYDGELRIASIILRPVEYDNYLKPQDEE